jgi:hypothetical protein
MRFARIWPLQLPILKKYAQNVAHGDANHIVFLGFSS